MNNNTFSIDLIGGQPGELLKAEAEKLNIMTEGRKLKLINLPDEYKVNPHIYAAAIMDDAVNIKLAPHEIGVIAREFRNEKTVQITHGAPTGKLKMVDGPNYTSMPSGRAWKAAYVIYDQNDKQISVHARKNDAVTAAKHYLVKEGLTTSLDAKLQIRVEHRLAYSNVCMIVAPQTKDTEVEIVTPANRFLFFGQKSV